MTNSTVANPAMRAFLAQAAGIVSEVIAASDAEIEAYISENRLDHLITETAIDRIIGPGIEEEEISPSEIPDISEQPIGGRIINIIGEEEPIIINRGRIIHGAAPIGGDVPGIGIESDEEIEDEIDEDDIGMEPIIPARIIEPSIIAFPYVAQASLDSLSREGARA